MNEQSKFKEETTELVDYWEEQMVSDPANKTVFVVPTNTAVSSPEANHESESEKETTGH